MPDEQFPHLAAKLAMVINEFLDRTEEDQVAKHGTIKGFFIKEVFAGIKDSTSTLANDGVQAIGEEFGHINILDFMREIDDRLRAQQ
jgi:hypothetical protein